MEEAVTLRCLLPLTWPGLQRGGLEKTGHEQKLNSETKYANAQLGRCIGTHLHELSARAVDSGSITAYFDLDLQWGTSIRTLQLAVTWSLGVRSKLGI